MALTLVISVAVAPAAYADTPTITSEPLPGAVVGFAFGRTAPVIDHAATDTNATISWSPSGDNGTGPGVLTDSRDLNARVVDVDEPVAISLYLANDSVEENSDEIVVAYSAADPEGAELMWTLAGDDADLFRVQQLGITPVYAVLFKQPPDYENPLDVGTDNTYTFTVSVSDGNTSTTPLNASVTVTDVNESVTVDEPVAISLSLANDSVEENSDEIVVAYSAADPEGAELMWTLAGDDADLFRVQQLGITPVYAVLFKQPPDYENPLDVGTDNTYTFTVSVSDGNTSTTPLNASVTVTDVNESVTVDEPVAISLSLANDSVEENSDEIVVAYSAADPEGAELMWTLAGDDADLFRVQQLGITPVYAVLFKQPPDYENPLDVGTDNTYTFTVSVSDGNTSTTPLNASVTVTDVNESVTVDEPVAISLSLANDSVEENSDEIVVAYSAADPEGAELMWTLAGDDADLFRVQQLGITPVYAVLFKQPPDYENPLDVGTDNTYTFTVSVSDGNTSTTPLNASVTVTDIDEDEVSTTTTSPVGGSVLAEEVSELFSDVPQGAYYKAAVTWMVQNGITNGCSESAFCPADPVTRQQVVTFLWRAEGSPEPERAGSSVFSDVAVGGYADKAIGWAAESRITLGCTGSSAVDDRRFCPADPVTRQQVVTFLWRAEGSPEPERAGSSVFSDVAVGGYADKAIGWAAESRITVGCTAEEFCPDDTADRAQTAVIIHRYRTTGASEGSGNR